MITAFASLYGMGGAPLCSMARGKKDYEKARRIMQDAFWMLVITGILLTIVGFLIEKPLLYALGASEVTYPYASSYLKIYLLGNLFVMIGLVKYVGNHSLYIKHFCFICILLIWILSLIPSCHREGEVGLS